MGAVPVPARSLLSASCTKAACFGGSLQPVPSLRLPDLPLAPLLVTGTVQSNGQIPLIVRRSSAEFPDTQKKVDTSEVQVSSYYS